MDIHIRYCWPHGINYLPGLLHSIELWQPPQIQILPFRWVGPTLQTRALSHRALPSRSATFLFTLHSPLSLFVLLTQIVSGDPHLFFIAGVYTALFLTVLCRTTQWGRHLLGRDSQGFNQIFISTSVILLKEWYNDFDYSTDRWRYLWLLCHPPMPHVAWEGWTSILSRDVAR